MTQLASLCEESLALALEALALDVDFVLGLAVSAEDQEAAGFRLCPDPDSADHLAAVGTDDHSIRGHCYHIRFLCALQGFSSFCSKDITYYKAEKV